MMEIRLIKRQTGRQLREEILAAYGSETRLRKLAAAAGAGEERETLAVLELLNSSAERLETEWKTTVVSSLTPREMEQFTDKRLRLLSKLGSSTRQMNVTGLAESLGRDKKNVSMDLRVLAKLGVVKMRRRGREATPQIQADELRIRLRGHAATGGRRSRPQNGRARRRSRAA